MADNREVNLGAQDVELHKQRYSRMMQFLCVMMIAVSIAISALLISFQVDWMRIVFAVVSVIMFSAFFILIRQGYLRTGLYGLVYYFSLSGVFGTLLFGWRSGGCALYLLVIPVILYNPAIHRIEKIILGLFLGLAVVASIIVGFEVVPLMELNALHLQLMNATTMILTCLALAGIIYIDFRGSKKVSAQLISLNKLLAYQASRDSLTDLFNRRTMIEFIQKEHARSCRSGKPFGLILTDVDDFKQVNDIHGHSIGDLVLTELSHLLNATLRKQDMISRWGGEEFLVLLPETDFEGVQIAAEKIRDLVSQSSLIYQGKPIQITVSLGGVVCQSEEDWDECIRQADRALYYGKKHGKNLAIFVKGEQYCILGCTEEPFVQQ